MRQEDFCRTVSDLPTIDGNNCREAELAKIDAYRRSHPELLAIARLYEADEIRRTVSDVESIQDEEMRRSFLKSLILGLSGDPGSCDRIINAYWGSVLLDDRDHHQAEFWLERMYSLIGR